MTRVNDDNNASLETYVVKDQVKVVERFFDLPLDYSNPTSKETIGVFARNLIPLNKAKTVEEQENLPYVLFLQGGPGYEVALQGSSGMAGELHERGYQTLWLDQRGTGLSTPIFHDTIPSRYQTDLEKADYLKFFRADSIVRDCEEIRKILLGDKEKPDERKWTLLGQSFGGCCSMTYLSFHSEGLKEVFMTGGLVSLTDNPEKVYRATIDRVIKRNEVYFQKYKMDIERIRNIVAYLSDNDVTLPNGGRLSVKRWQQLGLDFGSAGGIDRVHQLVLRFANDLSLFSKPTIKTLQLMEQAVNLDANPFFAILHEAIYCQPTTGAPRWAAKRVLDERPELFSWDSVKHLDNERPLYFIGEMILPEVYDDYVSLRPLKGVAEVLANDDQWSPLYDLDQLAKNEVNVSAATYVDDMYVDYNLAQETASQIKNVEQYVTNQLTHSGLRTDTKDVLGKLFKLSRREYD